eukprot:CAMPEP_0170614510 /NCGR_PEP_ID=MMETSP0224-20130122/24846_1 /TAXON_ID=285029 /ORGANISM="Togula jolla, Strain CCCM 725" /LENGTH=114 /DNA_ID=CAMNT_0010940187 /DNA_START=107 /DNA_END=447 /DNA_ORIENTATION=+
MAEVADDRVVGMKEALKQAQEGMKLFKVEEVAELDIDAASKFKEEMDAKIAGLEAEAAALTGKDNKKLRQEKDKDKTNLKKDKQYIDACKVVKGLQPAHGFFVKTPAAPKAAAV